MSKSIRYVCSLGCDLWNDTRGFIISAELVVISSLLVVGLIVGLTAMQQTVNAEMNDVAGAIGSLNQSYFYEGMSARRDCDCRVKSWTRGSCFTDLKDDCDVDQCEIAGDHFTCVNQSASAIVSQNEHVTTDVVVPRTTETAVIQKEETIQKEGKVQVKVNVTTTPEPAEKIVPIPEGQTTTVVPPAPNANCEGCVQQTVQPLATCCGQHSRCGCGKALGYGCQSGCGHAYGWASGYQSELPYTGFPTGSRVAPNAWGGVEHGGFGYDGYHGGYGGPSRFQSLDHTGYYRILSP